MKFTHAPEGGNAVEYEFDVEDLAELDAESIEEAGGAQWGTFTEWASLLDRGGFRAWRVLLWVLQRRTNPDLDLNEVKLKPKELRFDLTDPVGKDEGTTESDDSPTDSDSPKPDTDPSPSN